MRTRIVHVRVVNLRGLVLWSVGAYLLLRFFDAVSATILFFILATVLAIALDGPICWLQERGISRRFSVAILAFLLVVSVALGGYFGAPVLQRQVESTLIQVPAVSASLQERAERLTRRYPIVHDSVRKFSVKKSLADSGQAALPRIGRFSIDVFSGLVALILLAAVTFYAVGDPNPLVKGGIRALPKQNRRTGIRIYRRVQRQVQAWARATFWLMLIVGVLSGLGLWAIGVPSPLVFGMIAGLGEAVPVVGPILSCIPPLLVMLANDPLKALWVVLLFIAIQQIEGNILVPRIMSTAMELHPVPVLFTVVVMGTLTGPIGLLLAIPLLAIIKIIYEETYLRRVAGKPV